jgi:NhaP-type Na+/H+ or K+/H+ antiporter
MQLNAMAAIGGVLLAGFLCQWFSWRLRIPAILPLLLTGFVAGPVLGLVDPQALLGDLFTPFVSISVGIILFEGALTLNWKEARQMAGVVRNLLTIGALITWFGGAIAAHYLVGLPWTLAFLFGALIIVTGPTVIAPILRNVRPTANVGSILRWEGILIDPIGASIAVVVFELVSAGAGHTWQDTLVSFVLLAIVGSALGAGAALLVSVALNRYLVPDYLRDIMVLTSVIVVFVVSDALIHESGLFAVTVMGIYLANTNLRKLREVLYFKEKISLLLIASLFILLAANITFEELQMLTWGSVALLLVVMFVLRPLGVQISALRSDLNRNERLFLSWIAPRGIVAASVSSLFAFRLVERGFEEAAILEPLVFLIIVGTVLLQGITAKPLAIRLNISEADPQGFLIMGADQFARDLALAVKKAGFTVRLVDVNRANVTAARLAGLDAVQGNILSEYVESDLDLSHIGRLLAVTHNDEANALACKHFEDEFTSQEVYQLTPHLGDSRQAAPNLPNLGRLLFASHATCEFVTRALENGATIKTTPVTDKFTFQDFQHLYGEDALILVAYQGKQVLVPTSDEPIRPRPGWTLISLVKERAPSSNGADAGEIVLVA